MHIAFNVQAILCAHLARWDLQVTPVQFALLDTLVTALCAILDTKELAVPLVPLDITLRLLPVLPVRPSTATVLPAAVYLPVVLVRQDILAQLALIVQVDTMQTAVVASFVHPSTLTVFNALMLILALPARSASQGLLAMAALLATLEIVQFAPQDTKGLAVPYALQDTTPLLPPALLVLPLIVTASPAVMLPPASPAQLDTQQPVCA